MFGAGTHGASPWAYTQGALTQGSTHAADTIPNAYFMGGSSTSNAGTSPINFGVLKNSQNFNFYPQAGDLLLAFAGVDDDGAVMTATGWSLINSLPDATNFYKLHVYYKYATGTEAQSGTVWSWSYAAAGSSHTAVMLCYRGLNDAQLVIDNQTIKLVTPASTNMTTNGFVTAANRMVVMVAAQGGTPAAAASTNRITPAVNFTELQEKDEAAAWIEVAQKEDLVGTGSTIYTATTLASSINLTWIGAIMLQADVTPPTLEAGFFGA